MAKELTINKKMEEVQALTSDFKASTSVVVAEYRGLTVEQMTKLRRELRKENCELHVIKNNIIKRAALECGYNELCDELVGPNAICFAKGESVSAAKVLFEFAKQNKALGLKAGVVDGQYFNNEEIKVIATLPSRMTLLSMLAGGMFQPLQQLAIGLDMIMEQKN